MSDVKLSRRQLRFESIDDVLADAESLLASERAGRLQHVGNWSLGQTLGHLATWASFAYEGYPPPLQKPPWFVRFGAKLMRDRLLNKAMMSGLKIGRIPGGTVGIDDMPAEEGLGRLRRALTRLRNQVPTVPNPVFGPLSHEDWIKINLRHAELHLSFQVPQ